jgi:ATP-dependent helicase/nuclease subunit B
VQGRIKIWGLLEARLMAADRVVLGGLNETIWPPETRSDPFLNRAMRAELGLPPPERRIGQSAHEFALALASPEAIMVRARTVEGTPMVASRFLRRLDGFVGADAAKAMRGRGRFLIDAAVALDAAPAAAAAPRPNPKPDAAKQPTSLSVTEIRTLMRDPYAIYARHVLGLQPLDPLEAVADVRDRGNIIHDALAEFVSAAQADWPADPFSTLIAIGRRRFAPYAHIESVSAFWWPVFQRVAAWFADWEAARRVGIAASIVETAGSLVFPLADGTSFKLRSRADRIDQLQDGSLVILDYKTGKPPSGKQIALGLDPQLTLMAHIASQGLFADVPAGPIAAIAHVRLASESAEIIPKIERIPVSAEDVAQWMVKHVEGLKLVLNRLRSQQTGFLSRQRIEKSGDSGDYDHLAREREWAVE